MKLIIDLTDGFPWAKIISRIYFTISIPCVDCAGLPVSKENVLLPTMSSLGSTFYTCFFTVGYDYHHDSDGNLVEQEIYIVHSRYTRRSFRKQLPALEKMCEDLSLRIGKEIRLSSPSACYSFADESESDEQ